MYNYRIMCYQNCYRYHQNEIFTFILRIVDGLAIFRWWYLYENPIENFEETLRDEGNLWSPAVFHAKNIYFLNLYVNSIFKWQEYLYSYYNISGQKTMPKASLVEWC